MIKIEALAHKIAEKIALHLDFDDDKRDVVAYGLIAILQISTIFVIISVIGILFDFWYESLIIFLGVGIIRKSTGGAHAKTMKGCITLSVLSITLLSALSRYVLCKPINFYINLGLSIFVFVISSIIFYLRVPVDTPNKPITKPEKIRRLKKQSFIILTLLILISITFIVLASSYERFYSLAVITRLAVLWQLLTITKIGSLFIEYIDSMLSSISLKHNSI